MADLKEMLAQREWLLADGATGTNYFAMGLQSGEPLENWNLTQPDRVRDLHRRFIEAGSDIILTNTFGANPRRLMLHGAEDQTHEINKQAARHARAEADAAGSHIDVTYAMAIGLIPDCDMDTVASTGNAAGTGARIALLSRSARAEIEQVTNRVEKVETAIAEDIQEYFVAAINIPHASDPFPKLQAWLADKGLGKQ